MRPSRCRSRSSASWRAAGARNAAAYERWQSAAKRLDAAQARASHRSDRCRGARQDRSRGQARSKPISAASAAKLATRQSSQKVLEKLVPVVPGLIGGSADLTGSNGTLTKLHAIVKPGDFAGNYIHYGVREHGMAAAMNGMALHGGIVPYGGTFLVFSDYCRPSIRLSALMGKRVIYVMTHDSIGLGEDGPTHQPVEHLAALRAMPEPQRVPPGRFGRMRRMLGDRARHRGDAVDPGADPPGPAAAPDRAHRREPLAPRAPMCWSSRRASAT